MEAKPGKNDWYCPLYKRSIAEGKCLDINYEWNGWVNGGNLKEVTRLTDLTPSEIVETCRACPNCPNLNSPSDI